MAAAKAFSFERHRGRTNILSHQFACGSWSNSNELADSPDITKTGGSRLPSRLAAQFRPLPLPERLPQNGFLKFNRGRHFSDAIRCGFDGHTVKIKVENTHPQPSGVHLKLVFQVKHRIIKLHPGCRRRLY